jgi:hypothetical protein
MFWFSGFLRGKHRGSRAKHVRMGMVQDSRESILGLSMFSPKMDSFALFAGTIDKKNGPPNAQYHQAWINQFLT